ncbi:MAG: hypothetical protein A4E69_01465 [Syntrophus sp. PtaB.Bin138]|nr:MAG: hypothetical protein A4E69_01465 [Syntrophus sp. PtaB.Bin138]
MPCLREKSRNDERIDRQPGAATHERNHHHRRQPVPPVFQGSGCHDRRYGAAETDEHRDETLAVQPDFVHQTIHDEGRPGHVARIFQDRDGQKEQQNVRQKHDDPAHAADDAIHQKGLQQAFRSFRPPPCHLFPHPAEEGFKPAHGRIAQGKGQLEDKVHQPQKDRKTENTVRDDGINPIRHGMTDLDGGAGRFLADTGYKSIPAAGNGRLGLLPEGLLHMGRTFLDLGMHLRGSDRLAQFPVVFQQLDGQPSRIVFPVE